MPDDLLRALWDPTAPMPAGWPTGAWGAFLLFLIPIGGGIPTGVLMARSAGVSPPVMALLYLVSDIVQAFLNEPIVLLLRALARRVPVIGWLGRRLGDLTRTAGLRDGGRGGPLGLILVSFTVDPVTGRAAAAAAGHGFLSGWTLAIIGDMFYFALLMTSTLWLSDVIGDERLTVGIVLVGMLIVPRLIRRWRSSATVGRGAASQDSRVRSGSEDGDAAGGGPARPALVRTGPLQAEPAGSDAALGSPAQPKRRRRGSRAARRRAAAS